MTLSCFFERFFYDSVLMIVFFWMRSFSVMIYYTIKSFNYSIIFV